MVKRVVYPPNWTDLMTYCDWEWMSDITYKGIRNQLLAEGWSPAPPASQASAAAEYLAVFGKSNLTRGTAELSTLYRLDDVRPAQSPTPSDDWRLELRDAGGVALASHAFTPKRDTEAAPGEEVMGAIEETVPWVAGTARVVVLYRGGVAASRTVSANPPTVRVLYPNGGEVLSGAGVLVRWQASDPDGGTLYHALQYSPDNGATWQTLAVDVTATQLDVPLDDLPGSEAALFRVIASDGVNTARDASDGAFRVSRKAPRAIILSPSAGAGFALGQQVMLAGEGYDPEDGNLPAAGLAWSSDLQGALGTGYQLAVTTLSVGRHVITLRAVDSNGQSGSATVGISVGLPPLGVYLPIVMRSAR